MCPRLMASFLEKYRRSHTCGALRESDVGARVILTGWVQNYRDHGGLVFIDLRDREGVTQVVFDPGLSENAHRQAGELRSEHCIGIVGKVVARGANKNENLATGAIEVWADELEVFSKAETPPLTNDRRVNFMTPSHELVIAGPHHQVHESRRFRQQLRVGAGP